MKNPLIFLSLIVLAISCSKGNHTDAKKYEVPASLRAKIINEKIDAELEANRVDTCELETQTIGVLKRTLTKVVLFFRGGDDFDIKFNKDISQRIVDEIRASIFANLEFSPNEFWNLLTKETATELNEILIAQFIKVNNEQFEKLRDLTAFLYLFYFQEVERKAGYEVGLLNQEMEIPRIRVAFNEEANFTEREKLSLCNKLITSEEGFKTNHDFTYPSDIKGKVICEKDDTKLIVQQFLGREMSVSFIAPSLNHSVRFNHSELIVSETRRGSKLELTKDSDNFEINVYKKRRTKRGSIRKSYLTNTFSSVKVSGLVDGESIETKRMSCKTIRPVGYQYDSK